MYGVLAQEICSALERNLNSRSQAVRAATLQLLTSFQESRPEGRTDEDAETVEEKLLKIETAPLSVSSAGMMTTLLEGLKARLEFNTVPSQKIPMVVRALMGALNIRCPIILLTTGLFGMSLPGFRNPFLLGLQQSKLEDMSHRE